jgi:truncated hemoglobin YjbI
MTTDEWIFKVVEAFYAKAKTDILIGYHFRIIKDFDQHLPRIATFWEIQLLGKTQRNISEPFDLIKVHVPLGIKRGELGRWLLLFKNTLEQEVKSHPEMTEIKNQWLEKLKIFEGIFSRFFGF